MSKIVCYLRVSTEQQGSSGLGLEAQQAAVVRYASSIGADILQTFTEVETGKLNARPQLTQALHLVKVTGATLVIAKLDRLSRNASFLLNLQEAKVRFVAADMPEANNLTVGFMALIAQYEAEAISKRTKDALQEKKKQLAVEGKRLGNPNGAAALLKAGKGNTAALSAIKTKADSHAANLLPVLEALKAEGITSLGGIAKALNQRGMLTPRGGVWHKTSVSNLMARMPEGTQPC
jgi:DNA invertase Pin-like site-specific DNA recombinase